MVEPRRTGGRGKFVRTLASSGAGAVNNRQDFGELNLAHRGVAV